MTLVYLGWEWAAERPGQLMPMMLTMRARRRLRVKKAKELMLMMRARGHLRVKRG